MKKEKKNLHMDNTNEIEVSSSKTTVDKELRKVAN